MSEKPGLNRRDFLRLSAYSAAGAVVGSSEQLDTQMGSSPVSVQAKREELDSRHAAAVPYVFGPLLSTADLTAANILAPGRFGQALDMRRRPPLWVEGAFNREYMDIPLTVECWVKLDSAEHESVLLAAGYAVSPYQIISSHWVLSVSETLGRLTVTLQNMNPSTLQSPRSLADGEWHFVAMTLEPDRASLYVDGRALSRVEVHPKIEAWSMDSRTNEGPQFIGGFPPDARGSSALIDEVRISRGVRQIDGIPDHPFEADAATIGLWHFDELDDAGHFVDYAPTNKPLVVKPYLPTLDEHDRREFGVSTSPFDRAITGVTWQITDITNAAVGRTAGAEEQMLNGSWDCVGVDSYGVSEDLMLADSERWVDAFTAQVPCTIQTALLDNGLIDDPMLQMNNLQCTPVADREWWLRRTFVVPENWRDQHVMLWFDGVDYGATFWLNGYRLGQHQGMFGGPDFDVSALLKYGDQENHLVVRLDPAPPNYVDTFKNSVAYGWHYVKLVTLGIWRPVHLQMRRDTALDHPFLRTVALDDDGATVELAADCWHWGATSEELTLDVQLVPKNFNGSSYTFSSPVTVEPGPNEFGFDGRLEGVRPWWPVDMGDPNLYWFECILRRGEEVVDRYRSHWGARTVEMHPNSDGPHPHLYNWQFVINGQPIWVKGTNWCLTDALLRMGRQRNERYVELARHAHVQLLRIWGGGPIENDELYDLCDEMGLMTQQEFPMLGFHRLQNLPSSHATDITHYMVKRLRNRPSLVMWAGANEISGQGRIVEVLGRRCLELDGTRPFHRTCPYGGDVHWHDVYWGERPLLDYRQVATGGLEGWSPGIGGKLPDGPIGFTEFGLSSPANHETWRRLLPPEEWEAWPPRRDAVFIHHTPTYEFTHVDKMTLYARDFLEPANLPELITGMQLSQGLGMKFLIESMRARKPQTTATYFYKLTENYPSCSWATIDYYGVPKRSHYDIREAYEPVHVMAIFDDWATHDGTLPLTIYAVNDTAAVVDAQLEAVLYDGQFNVLESETHDVSIPIDKAVVVADKSYMPSEVERPLFLRLDLVGDQGRINRNWYYFDFADKPGTLFARPQTTLMAELRRDNGTIFVVVQNTGYVPALSLELHLGEASNTYYAEESGLWLEPDERVTIILIRTDAVDGETRDLETLRLSAWNAEPVEIGV